MYDLHLLGWHDFQRLCLTISREVLGQSVQAFSDSGDGGRDAAFSGTWNPAGKEDFAGLWVIQAKFKGKRDTSLSLSDVTAELKKAKALVSVRQCDVYILMTNARVSGPMDLKIRAAFSEVGVKQVTVFGYDWICQTITESKRLRMYVPRLYGLGDLSTILDERAYTQSRALLESLKEDLARVVVTEAYSKAATALDLHRFVLLVGEPAAGKTTIASMLSLAASDLWGAQTLKLDEATQVTHEHWNPEGPSQFFWVDDAFGMTQLDMSRVVAWNHSLSRLESMLKHGTRVVLTSRDYIYAKARGFLKKGAFPLLDESQVVINVKDLTQGERHQILYNHIRLGNQSRAFKTSIKPWLTGVADNPRFIPETARRLGSPFFTRSLTLGTDSIAAFVERQRELLVEVISGLDADSRAALALIYMRNAFLESPIELSGSERDVIERFGSETGLTIAALQHLRGSLVHLSTIDDRFVWSFKHPTIRDAFASFLLSEPELLGVYVQGVSLRDLVNEVTCGNVGIQGAVVLPAGLFPVVNARLIEAITHKESYNPNEKSLYSLAKNFLIYRCSDHFIKQFPLPARLLEDIAAPGMFLNACNEVELGKRLHKLTLLPDECRRSFVATVSAYALEGSDLSVFNTPSLASMFIQEEWDDLISGAIDRVVFSLQEIEANWTSNFSSDDDPSAYMSPLIDGLEGLEKELRHDAIWCSLLREEIIRLKAWVEGKEIQSSTAVEESEHYGYRKAGRSEFLPAFIAGIFGDVDE